MNKPKLEYRMYGLVPYNISPIQQGIQYGHAVVEYALEHSTDENYKKWASEDKTFIILNGGTTNTNPTCRGSLNEYMRTIHQMGIDYATFYEPDLGDQLTAVVFLLDERVWDRKKYPDPNIVLGMSDKEMEVATQTAIIGMGGPEIYELRQFISQFRLA
jgi:hypothetical protein